MTYALDTNLLVRWLVRDIEDQSLRVDPILEDKRQKLHVADMAITELVFVLSRYYELSDEKIARSVQKLIEHDNINCNRQLFTKVLDDFVKSPKASFVDICLAHYAGLQDAKLLTFDKSLARKLPKLVQLA